MGTQGDRKSRKHKRKDESHSSLKKDESHSSLKKDEIRSSLKKEIRSSSKKGEIRSSSKNFHSSKKSKSAGESCHQKKSPSRPKTNEPKQSKRKLSEELKEKPVEVVNRDKKKHDAMELSHATSKSILIEDEDLECESNSFWEKQASVWVDKKTSAQGSEALMSVIAAQMAIQVTAVPELNLPLMLPGKNMFDVGMGVIPGLGGLFGQGNNGNNFSPKSPIAPMGMNHLNSGQKIMFPIPAPPLDFPSIGLQKAAPATTALPSVSKVDDSRETIPMPPPGGKAIPQWLRDAVKAAKSKSVSAEKGTDDDEAEIITELMTPSSKGGSPREQSPEKGSPPSATKIPTDFVEGSNFVPLSRQSLNKAKSGTSSTFVDQIKGVVTDILVAVTDEIFREAAREAIGNHRRKQRIMGKTTIGLKLGGNAGAPSSAMKESVQSVNEKVDKNENSPLGGIFNPDVVTAGTFRCPSNATAPPKGVFKVILFEDGVEVARVPFIGTHLLLGSSPKFSNIVDDYEGVSSQHCSLYFSTKQLHQQGGGFFVVPLGGETRLLNNKYVPFLLENIKAKIGSSSSRKVDAYIRRHKRSWEEWDCTDAESTLLNAGDQCVTLNENRSCFVMGKSRRVYFIDVRDVSKRLTEADRGLKHRETHRSSGDGRSKRRRTRSDKKD